MSTTSESSCAASSLRLLPRLGRCLFALVFVNPLALTVLAGCSILLGHAVVGMYRAYQACPQWPPPDLTYSIGVVAGLGLVILASAGHVILTLIAAWCDPV